MNGTAVKARFSTPVPALFVFSAALWLVTPPVPAQSPPGLSVQVSNAFLGLRITGDIGSACTIQYCTDLSPANNWQVLTNLTTLPGSPCLVVDTSPATSQRYYRTFSQQVSTNAGPTNMVWIPPGSFVMGSPDDEAWRHSDETQHAVRLTKGFYMGKYGVTQGEYLALIGSNPSYFTTRDNFGHPISPDLNRPVEQVSWIDATNYCARLTQQEQTAGRLPAGWVYRLPTESEREYACRAGTTTAFCYGSALRSGMANFDALTEYDASVGEINNPNGIYLGRTTTVGSYQPNAWGLYDMHGNVHEWCQDWYGSYPTGSVTDPQGAESGSYDSSRVVRGGGWFWPGVECRSARRNRFDPSGKAYTIGFRVVLAPSQP
jgi:formylglycine-generating enzyme required for sulfatase activity